MKRQGAPRRQAALRAEAALANAAGRISWDVEGSDDGAEEVETLLDHEVGAPIACLVSCVS